MNNWEKNIRKVVPYTPGEQPNQPDMIKLNTNENPYPPAPGVAEVLKNTETDALRLYPDPAAKDLVHAIAAEYGILDEQVFVGVGSDDVLAMSFLTVKNRSSFQILRILSTMYGQICFRFRTSVRNWTNTSI